MKMRRHVFVDLRSDFGFKHCMSDPLVMKSFLNAVIGEDVGHIESVEFKNVEAAKRRRRRRGVTFDLRCQLSDGSEVLVEMQNYAHQFFKTRANYYLYKLMDEHVPKGVAWTRMESDIPRLIGIFIIGKKMQEFTKPITRSAECDLDDHTIFWDRMRKYYLSLHHVEMPSKTSLGKEIWLYIFKELGNMDNIDKSVLETADAGLLQLIEKARTAALTDEEYVEYEASLKEIADEGAAEHYGYRQGKEEGRREGLAEGRQEGLAEGEKLTALRMIQKGFSDEIIADLCPMLTPEEIQTLRTPQP